MLALLGALAYLLGFLHSKLLVTAIFCAHFMSKYAIYCTQIVVKNITLPFKPTDSVDAERLRQKRYYGYERRRMIYEKTAALRAKQKAC
jgi:hypothetical protein